MYAAETTHNVCQNLNRDIVAGTRALPRTLLATAILSGLFVLTQPIAAMAQVTEQASSWNLPAGPLDQALNQLAAQSKLTISYSPDLVKGKTTRGLSGTYAPAEALRKLLIGSGITFDALSATTFALRRAPVASTPAAPTSETGRNPRVGSTSQEEMPAMQAIVVTGSNVRRVDVVTSNPVDVVTSQQIQDSGKETLSDLLQTLPANAGAPIGPQVNSSGGGSGYGSVSLRGLGSSRTLVLIDGHRYENNDLNAIPVRLIERIEVLKDGGSTAYGSDAVGGVVNIILKQNYEGNEISVNYGITDYDDGNSRGANILFGRKGDKGNIVADISYNKQDGISSANRSYSNQALYLSSGTIVPTGSSRNPNGRIFLPSNLASQFGCNSVTLASGNGTSLNDYKCFNIRTDAYNFQQNTWILIPQERANAYFLANYDLSGNTQAFAEVLYNKTRSQEGDPPAYLDANASDLEISKYSMYNPFGVDLGGEAGYEFLTRFTGIGQRLTDYDTTTSQATFGVKGAIGEWEWNAYYNYGRIQQRQYFHGYPFFSDSLRSALGPSMLVDGTPTCVSVPGDATTAISNCTPINIFDQKSASVSALLSPFFATLSGNDLNTRSAYYANADGPLFELSGGAVQAAVGVDYQKEYAHNTVDARRLITDVQTGTCNASHELCGTDLQGEFNVQEAYAELFLPVLKDAPVVGSLNVTLGGRYTKNSLAGSSNNFKVAVEERPTEDLLLRGTVTQVFRAPTIDDLFAGPVGGSPALVDPCVGLSASALAAHSRACAGVPANWAGTEVINVDVVREGAVAAGIDLKPEFGKSFDFGLVYEPHYIQGISLDVDFWRVSLHDTLTLSVAQSIMDVCFKDDGNALCNLITRRDFDHSAFMRLPVVNLGDLYVSGVDFGIQYKIPETDWLPGHWSAKFDATYISRADSDAVPGIIATTHMAGKYVQPYGSFPRFRALANLNWSWGMWHASWRTRYVGKSQDGSADPSQDRTADMNLPNVVLKIPAVLYNDVHIGCDIRPINTSVDVGINNLFNRQPPFITQKDVGDANTDVSTYDMIGRAYWARATIRF
ncbi:MAG: TonB-dependent receptor [Rudaea sp.]|uniref:TonB-dependent receptor domain-containing protein n=1 Tax=Rudaea sp. TaxID=2136325 RepID=UPI0039E5F94C